MAKKASSKPQAKSRTTEISVITGISYHAGSQSFEITKRKLFLEEGKVVKLGNTVSAQPIRIGEIVKDLLDSATNASENE